MMTEGPAEVVQVQQDGMVKVSPAVVPISRPLRGAEKYQYGCFAHRTRYLILLLGTLCLTSICSNMIIYNFTLICMDAEHQADITLNTTTATSPIFTSGEKTALFWSVGFGTILAAFPFNWLYLKFGARYVFFSAGVLSLISTALTPLAVHSGFVWFMTMRFIQGVAFGSDFAAIGLITVQWASLKQNAIFIAMLTSFSQYAVIVTMPIAGVLCESSWGWPSVYYLHVVVGTPLFILWFIFYRDDPRFHPTVSEIELEKIHREKSESHRNNELAVPYKALLSNLTIWSVWLCAFGDLLVAQLVVMYGPTYLHQVLKFGVAHTGYFVTLPLIPYIFTKIGSGFASDWITSISEKTKMLIFNTVSILGCAFMLIILGFMDSETAVAAIILLVLIEMSFGPNVGGFYKCAAIVTRQYNHFVLSSIQFIKCLALFIEPALNWLFVSPANSPTEWRIVFFIHAAILIVSTFAFIFFISDQPAEFTKDKKSTEFQQIESIDKAYVMEN